MRIDAHQHYWSIARTDYGWLTRRWHRCGGIICRRILRAACGRRVTHTILVQAAPSEAETRYPARHRAPHTIGRRRCGLDGFHGAECSRRHRGAGR